MLLTWNRDAEAIRNASKAVLSISDGDQHENVDMDLAQLANGSIVYSPSGTDISFKMEVIDKTQKKTTSESVRMLRTRPSPLQEQTTQPPRRLPRRDQTGPGATPAGRHARLPSEAAGRGTAQAGDAAEGLQVRIALAETASRRAHRYARCSDR